MGMKERLKENQDYRKKFEKEFGPTELDFGVEISKGWQDLVWNLTNCITNYIKQNEKGGSLHLSQIKEKFGLLRYYFYLKNVSEDGQRLIRGMVWFAESLSGTICEHCGKKGKSVSARFGWLLTLCPKCLEETLKPAKPKK